MSEAWRVVPQHGQHDYRTGSFYIMEGNRLIATVEHQGGEEPRDLTFNLELCAPTLRMATTLAMAPELLAEVKRLRQVCIEVSCILLGETAYGAEQLDPPMDLGRTDALIAKAEGRSDG